MYPEPYSIYLRGTICFAEGLIRRGALPSGRPLCPSNPEGPTWCKVSTAAESMWAVCFETNAKSLKKQSSNSTRSCMILGTF